MNLQFYFEVVCLWFTESCIFAAELNLEIKRQDKNTEISPNFICGAISPHVDRM
jgi:hypothetical protein